MSNKLSSIGIISQVVIPARLASTRLPEKLLLNETGMSVIEHTFRAASSAMLAHKVTVAVDHQRLYDEVQRFGGSVEMTNPHAQCGTERVAEIASKNPDVEIWVNVQGDEPEIDARFIDRVIQLLYENPASSIATLATPIRSKENLDDPNCVKVIMDHKGQAVYFSRSVIPYPRTWSDQLLTKNPPVYLQHLGIYAYRREFLQQLAQLPESELESIEKLEQLRFLQAGHVIAVGVVDHASRGIDTRADYDAFLRRIQAGKHMT